MQSNDSESSDQKKIDPIQKLDKLLESAEDKGNRIVQMAREATKSGQELVDVSHSIRGVIEAGANIPEIESLITDAENVNREADSALSQFKFNDTGFSAGTASLSTTSTSILVSSVIYHGVPEAAHPRLTAAVNNLSQVLDRSADSENVIRLMNNLGLNTSARGLKSPLEQFITAHDAYARPITGTNPIITSLIPMRESIQLTFDYLIKHRPKQEQAKRDWEKIISIGHLLGYDSLSGEHFQTLGYQWGQISNKDLSTSKDQDVLREEWRKRLTRSTLFLKALLESIDPNKLRH
jgi:hypothetical protein